MTVPFSLTHRYGRKFTRRRERQMAFLKALGETGSVAHAAVIVDFDRCAFCSGA
jgi:molybdenum-dependent DNA-binding transcriptional regulator ModE